MNLQDALDRYHGSKLNLDELSKYQQWALRYFHNEEFVINPYLSMTLQLELTTAREAYEKSFQDAPGASFQSYLVWNLVKALCQEWTFSTRNIDGDWYLFKNLPVYFPIAIGGELRFKDVIIENAALMDWRTFTRVYRDAIDKPITEVGTLDQLTWALSFFIGNLPNLNFTSFQIHRGAMKTGRPLFYFGQRYRTNSKYTVPLSITIDHANADPYVLDKLLKTYQGFLSGV